jgi:hypothetical protein
MGTPRAPAGFGLCPHLSPGWQPSQALHHNPGNLQKEEQLVWKKKFSPIVGRLGIKTYRPSLTLFSLLEQIKF